jgi:iron complex outermembrane receptor protein
MKSTIRKTGSGLPTCRRLGAFVASMVLGFAVGWLPSGYALAQSDTAGQSSPAAQTQSGDNGLEEVVVTAERRATDVLSTPISMTVTTGDELTAQHQVQLQDLALTTPDFTVNETGDTHIINIRGVGTEPGIGNAGYQPGVAIIRDGLLDPEQLGIDTNTPFYDLQDIEVLKGPQGTLVGASSTGGAVEINSRNPVLGGNGGYVEAQWGNYDDIRVDGGLNLPISSTIAARIAWNLENQNSFYKDVASIPCCAASDSSTDPGNSANRNVRLGILWQPTDDFQALLKMTANYYYTAGIPQQPNLATYTNTVTGQVLNSPYYAYYSGSPFIINPHIPQSSNETSYPITLNLQYTLPDQIMIRDLTGFEDTTNEFVEDPTGTSYVGGTFWGGQRPDRYYTEEIDVLSPTTWRVNFIAGAMAFYRATVGNVNGVESTPPFTPSEPLVLATSGNPPGCTICGDEGGFRETQRTQGIFGQVNWEVTREVEVYLGLRENFDGTFGDGGISTYIPGLGNIAFCTPGNPCINGTQGLTGYGVIGVPNSGHFFDTVTTGKVGVNWKPAEGQYFFAFAAKGYKAGGTTDVGTLFNPEAVYDYEAGWKGRLFDGHLQAQIGGFYMDYLHMQQQEFQPVFGQNILNLSSPSTIDGIEATINGKQGGFGYDASLALLHSKLGSTTVYASYEIPARVSSGVPQCTGAGGAVAGPGQGNCFNFDPYLINISGEENPLSPKVSLHADLYYRFEVGGNGNSLTPKVTYSYTASQYASLFEIPYNELPSYALWGANLTYEAGPWTVAAYGLNLANRVYISGNSGSFVWYGPPEQFGIRVNRTLSLR